MKIKIIIKLALITRFLSAHAIRLHYLSKDISIVFRNCKGMTSISFNYDGIEFLIFYLMKTITRAWIKKLGVIKK